MYLIFHIPFNLTHSHVLAAFKVYLTVDERGWTSPIQLLDSFGQWMAEVYFGINDPRFAFANLSQSQYENDPQ